MPWIVTDCAIFDPESHIASSLKQINLRENWTENNIVLFKRKHNQTDFI